MADNEGRDDRQHRRRQQLVRYAEERPDDADVALYDQVHPGNGDDKGADHDARLPVAVAEGFIDLAQQFLQQVAAYAAASVDQRQDEERFEHDAEMVPQAHEVIHAGDLGENVRHADSQGYRAARAVHQIFADHLGQRRQILYIQAELRESFGRRIDGEIIARMEAARRDQSHDGNEGLRKHRAVADGQSLPFIFDHLRRRAGSDDAVETGNRAAGDGDEQIREYGARQDRAAAPEELGERRHADLRRYDDDADRQKHDRADFHIRGQIITGRQEQPDRKYRSKEAVHAEHDLHLFQIIREERSQRRIIAHIRARDDRRQDKSHTEDRRFLDLAGADIFRVNADDDSRRDRHADGEEAPRAVVQGIGHDDRHARFRDDQQQQHDPQSRRACRVGYLIPRDLGQRLALVADRRDEHDHIMHSARENRTEKQPQQPRHEAELRCDDRAYQRTRARDGREMMAEHDPLIRGHVVLPVFELISRRLLELIQREHLRGDPRTVQTIRQHENADSNDDQVQTIHYHSLLSPLMD